MTEAEKAAAAKAEAEAKTKAEAEKAAAEKAKNEAGSDDDEKPDDKPMSRADFEAFKTKANKEAEKHRLRAKASDEALETMRKSFAQALGIKVDGEPAGVDAAAKASLTKQRNLLLRSEFVGIAANAGAFSPSDAFELARPYLKDVAVDLEAETADGAAISEALELLKKSKPFLFRAESGQNGGTGGGKPPERMPDGRGTSMTGGTAYEQWMALEAAGRRAEAAAFYGKNKPAIKATWKK
jgi:colicin import membrane protein